MTVCGRRMPVGDEAPGTPGLEAPGLPSGDESGAFAGAFGIPGVIPPSGVGTPGELGPFARPSEGTEAP